MRYTAVKTDSFDDIHLEHLIIIIVPPRQIYNQLDDARQTLCDCLGNHTSLAYPPHILLRPDLKVPAHLMPEFITELGDLLKHTQPFKLTTSSVVNERANHHSLNQYSINLPIPPTPRLRRLNGKLLTYHRFRHEEPVAFTPHIPLFTGELSKEEQAGINQFIQLSQHTVKLSRNTFQDSSQSSPVRDTILRLSKRYSWNCDTVSIFRFHRDCWLPYHTFNLNHATRTKRSVTIKNRVCNPSPQNAIPS